MSSVGGLWLVRRLGGGSWRRIGMGMSNVSLILMKVKVKMRLVIPRMRWGM